MTDSCFNCKYHDLEGDTYFSQWVCKKHGKLPADNICRDYKKIGFNVDEGTYILIMISLIIMMWIVVLLCWW